jgi:hypothetical protein
VRTVTAELSLSGRAGGQRLNGRALVGFAKPAAMRLEGVAPFGAPAFILASDGKTATLLLPRDNRVVRRAGADQILGALTGIALAPDDLLAILTGCVTTATGAVAGRLYGDRWASIDLADGSTMYLRREEQRWQIRAGRHRGWRLEYPAWVGGFPQVVRLVSEGAGGNVDVATRIGQLEANAPLDTAAFAVNVPPNAIDISVEELRNAGPLRGQ